MSSPKRLARTAGVFYLIVAIFGGFAQVVRVRVYVPGDAATTVEHVVADASLVRMSFVADLVQAAFFLFVVMALYRLLRHVNRNVAHAMVILVVVSVGITCLNMVHQLGALLVATDPSYIGAFGTEGSAGLVLLLLDLQRSGYLIAQIFFGLWLFPLGLLAYRSGMFPRLLGVMLMLTTLSYLVDVVLQFLAPGLAGAINPFVVVLATLSEVSMLAYLLIKGIREPLSTDRVLVTT
jgi:hypothetical protein